MKSGDENALRNTNLLAENLLPLLKVISTAAPSLV